MFYRRASLRRSLSKPRTAAASEQFPFSRQLSALIRLKRERFRLRGRFRLAFFDTDRRRWNRKARFERLRQRFPEKIKIKKALFP